MKLRLKNNSADIILFVSYHLLGICTAFIILVFINAQGSIDSLDFLMAEIERLFENKPQAVAIPDPMIEKTLGTVFVSQSENDERLVKRQEVLKKGMTLETMDQSTALLSYSGKYQWQVRVGPRTRIKAESLVEKSRSTNVESTIYQLIEGAAMIGIKKKKEPVGMKIKTSLASFGVRGTKFVVFTNGREVVMTVYEGTVEALNNKNFKMDLVEGGNTYVIYSDGKSHMEKNKEIQDLHEWKLEILDSHVPEISTILSMIRGEEKPEEKVENAEPATEKKTKPEEDKKPVESTKNDENEKANSQEETAKIIKTLDQKIASYKKRTESLREGLANLRSNIIYEEDEYNLEKPKIDQDISCLEKSQDPCTLHLEKTLIKRGFPRTHGTPRFRSSLVDNLRLYMKERTDGIAEKKTEAKNLERLLREREAILASIIKKKERGENLKGLILMLNEKSPEEATE